MTQQERIELLSSELKEIATLLDGMSQYEAIPGVFLNMARDKALRLADGFEKLAALPKIKEESAEVSPIAVKPAEANPVEAKPTEAKAEEVKPVDEKPVAVKVVEIKPVAEVKKEPMSVKEAFSPVFKEFTHTPVKSAEKEDLRSRMTLNDRFLFQRELFRGDIGMLNYTLDEVNKLATMDEALRFIENQYHWDAEASGVKEFMELLERHFNGTII